MTKQNQDYAEKYAKENQNFDKKELLKVGDVTYVPVIMVKDYLTTTLKTPFGIPCYKTVMLWIKKGVLPKAKKLGNKSYIEVDKIIEIVKSKA
jgi:hypothetical protein